MPFLQPKPQASATDTATSFGTLGGFYGTKVATQKGKADLSSVAGLLQLAKEKGLLNEADEIVKKDQLSFLQRLSVGLGALNPAEAIMKSRDGAESFLTAYPTSVVQGIAAAFTGTDYGEQTKRRYFEDLVKDLQIQNQYAQFGLGLVGDILLDPSTFFGGSIARGAIGVTKVAGRGILKGIEKASPEAAARLIESGQALKDAGGHLFVHGYGASKVTTAGEDISLADKYLEFQGQKVNVEKALAVSNAKRYGSDVMTDAQHEEFLSTLFAGKQAEFQYTNTVTDEMLQAFEKKYPNIKFPLLDSTGMKAKLSADLGREASDLEVKAAVREQASRRLENLQASIPEKIGKLQATRDALAKPFLEDDLFGLKSVVQDLKQQLSELIPTVVKQVEKKPGVAMATASAMDNALMDALSIQKGNYAKLIKSLQDKITAIETGVLVPAEKQLTETVAAKGTGKLTADEMAQKALRKADPSLRIKDKIVQLQQDITKLTNEMNDKTHILQNALDGKTIAKERIANAFKTGDFSALPEDVTAALRPHINDPVVEKAFTERLARNEQLAAAAGVDNPFSVYAPSIRNDVSERERTLQFFNGIRSVKVGSEGYKKEFRGLLKENELIKDRQLFLRVEDQVATNNLTQHFLEQTVVDYGVPKATYKSEEAAMKDGYRMLKEKGSFGKDIGYVKEDDWKFLNSQMNANFGALDAIAKATGFDVITSLFKRWVTGPFASFHVRNFASGEMQNFELIGATAQMPKVQAAGLRLGNKISRGAFIDLTDPFDKAIAVGAKVKDFGDETIELAGKTWNLNDIGTAISRRFGGSSRYNVDYNSITGDAEKLIDAPTFSKEAIKGWGKSFVSLKLDRNPIEAIVGENNPLFKAARGVGAFIEMQQKAKLVVGALQKGHTLEEALGIAAKGGFDYRALTQFESRIMRRVIPFYSFARKNIELQLHVLGENPQRINQIIRSIGNVQNMWQTDMTDKEKENLPAYLKESLSVAVGRSDTGALQFVQSFGTPIEAFTQLFKGAAEGKSTIERQFLGTLSMVNPYLKVPIELGIGKDSFRQRDLKDVYTAPEYAKAPEIIKNFLMLHEVKKKNFATGVPYTQYVADPERLLVVRSLFTSRGFTYFNNIFNSNTTGFLTVLNAASGIKINEVDTERQAGYTDRRLQDELGAILRRNGIVSEFNKLFIPSNKPKK